MHSDKKVKYYSGLPMSMILFLGFANLYARYKVRCLQTANACFDEAQIEPWRPGLGLQIWYKPIDSLTVFQ